MGTNKLYNVINLEEKEVNNKINNLNVRMQLKHDRYLFPYYFFELPLRPDHRIDNFSIANHHMSVNFGKLGQKEYHYTAYLIDQNPAVYLNNTQQTLYRLHVYFDEQDEIKWLPELAYSTNNINDPNEYRLVQFKINYAVFNTHAENTINGTRKVLRDIQKQIGEKIHQEYEQLDENTKLSFDNLLQSKSKKEYLLNQEYCLSSLQQQITKLEELQPYGSLSTRQSKELLFLKKHIITVTQLRYDPIKNKKDSQPVVAKKQDSNSKKEKIKQSNHNKNSKKSSAQTQVKQIRKPHLDEITNLGIKLTNLTLSKTKYNENYIKKFQAIAEEVWMMELSNDTQFTNLKNGHLLKMDIEEEGKKVLNYLLQNNLYDEAQQLRYLHHTIDPQLVSHAAIHNNEDLMRFLVKINTLPDTCFRNIQINGSTYTSLLEYFLKKLSNQDPKSDDATKIAYCIMTCITNKKISLLEIDNVTQLPYLTTLLINAPLYVLRDVEISVNPRLYKELTSVLQRIRDQLPAQLKAKKATITTLIKLAKKCDEDRRIVLLIDLRDGSSFVELDNDLLDILLKTIGDLVFNPKIRKVQLEILANLLLAVSTNENTKKDKSARIQSNLSEKKSNLSVKNSKLLLMLLKKINVLVDLGIRLKMMDNGIFNDNDLDLIVEKINKKNELIKLVSKINTEENTIEQREEIKNMPKKTHDQLEKYNNELNEYVKNINAQINQDLSQCKHKKMTQDAIVSQKDYKNELNIPFLYHFVISTVSHPITAVENLNDNYAIFIYHEKLKRSGVLNWGIDNCPKQLDTFVNEFSSEDNLDLNACKVYLIGGVNDVKRSLHVGTELINYFLTRGLKVGEQLILFHYQLKSTHDPEYNLVALDARDGTILVHDNRKPVDYLDGRYRGDINNLRDYLTNQQLVYHTHFRNEDNPNSGIEIIPRDRFHEKQKEEAQFFYNAVEKNDLFKLIELVEESSINVNASTENGYTALQMACICNNIEIAVWLIFHGAYLNQANLDLIPDALGKKTLETAARLIRNEGKIDYTNLLNFSLFVKHPKQTVQIRPKDKVYCERMVNHLWTSEGLALINAELDSQKSQNTGVNKEEEKNDDEAEEKTMMVLQGA